MVPLNQGWGPRSRQTLLRWEMGNPSLALPSPARERERETHPGFRQMMDRNRSSPPLCVFPGPGPAAREPSRSLSKCQVSARALPPVSEALGQRWQSRS